MRYLSFNSVRPGGKNERDERMLGWDVFGASNWAAGRFPPTTKAPRVSLLDYLLEPLPRLAYSSTIGLVWQVNRIANAS